MSAASKELISSLLGKLSTMGLGVPASAAAAKPVAAHEIRTDVDQADVDKKVR